MLLTPSSTTHTHLPKLICQCPDIGGRGLPVRRLSPWLLLTVSWPIDIVRLVAGLTIVCGSGRLALLRLELIFADETWGEQLPAALHWLLLRLQAGTAVCRFSEGFASSVVCLRLTSRVLTPFAVGLVGRGW